MKGVGQRLQRLWLGSGLRAQVLQLPHAGILPFADARSLKRLVTLQHSHKKPRTGKMADEYRECTLFFLFTLHLVMIALRR